MGFEFNLMENDAQKNYLELLEEIDNEDLIEAYPEEDLVKEK